MLLTILRVIVAIVAAVLLYLAGASVIRKFTIPAEEEPDPNDLRPVDYRYRCTVCGAEVTMTAAPGDEMPDPPRHCREDMALVVEAGNEAP